MTRDEALAMRLAMQERAANFLTGDFTLRCPVCGGEYLHHERIEIFSRLREDAPWWGITVERGVPVADCSAPNPSSRRDGLLLFFWCETCNLAARDTPLAIYQEKGRTFVAWRSFREAAA